MLTTNKVLNLCVPLQIKTIETKEGDSGEELHITGLASTNDEDRSGDIIASDAWKKSGALDNYLKNPIILAFHDMSQPIGKTIAHEVTDKGLKITAKISKTADKIIALIKEGILSAFSVGFMIKDADFDPKSGVFMIKELELYEVSVVSVPANQNALFSIEKNFSNKEEYLEFRKQFIKESEETLMDKPDQVDLAKLAKEISAMVKGDIEAERKAKEEADRKAKEEADRISVTATTAAERLVKDLEAKMVDQNKGLAEALDGIREALKKNTENGEVEKVFANRENKMEYNRGGSVDVIKSVPANVRDGILYASKIFNKDATNLKAFKDLITKSGMEHWDSSVVGEWEEEYSTRVQNALREQLVVEPLFTSIPMSTPTMNLPINPEAGDATWVHNAALRSSRSPEDETGNGTNTSTGSAQDHQISEQTLIAYKLATREYIGYEEEEDSIVALAPIIRDAVTRRMARAADLAFLRGAGVLTNTTAYDPIVGLVNRGTGTTDVTVSNTAGSAASWRDNFSEDLIVDLRRNLGIYGLDPSNLTLLVSHDLYYELMKLPNFKTVDVLANRATILTGEVGSLFGIKVLVSQMFDNAAITANTVGTVLAVLCRPSNFVKGELRGILTESDKDVINQKRVLVSSRRFGFQEIIAGVGTVNLEIAS